MLLDKASRQRVKDIISIELRKIETEVIKLKDDIKTTVPSLTANTSNLTPKRYVVELQSYAWDQSDKYVKIFITFEDTDTPLENEMVNVEFTEKSLKLKITNFLSKDHSLIINNLLEEIDVGKSHWKVKKDMITIFMKKVNENHKWNYITSTEKRLKDSKSKEMADNMSLGDQADPGAGLMNVLKKMYDSGDSETKRMINKAWQEGQDQKGKKNFEL